MAVNQSLSDMANTTMQSGGSYADVWSKAAAAVNSGAATWQDVWDTATNAGVLDQLAQGAGVTTDQLRQYASGAGVNTGTAPGPTTYGITPPSIPNAPTATQITLPETPTFVAPVIADAPTFTAPTASPAPTFTAPDAVNVTAAQHQLDPTNETVQGQLNTILSQDGPLMQRAEAQGIDSMSSRGLTNSSMAVGAAQGAMMDRALPIASQDASTYFQNSMQNLGFENAARQQNAQAANQLNLAGFQANVTAAMTAYSAQQQFAMAGFQANVNAKMATWNAQTQATMSTWQANVTSSQQAYAAAVNALTQQNQNAFSASMAQYTAGVNAQMAAYEAAINAGQLDFKVRADMELQMAADAAKLQQLQVQHSGDMELQQLRNDASVQLANIEAQYKSAIQSNDSAKSLYAQISKNITDIMTDPNIPAEEKNGLIQQQSEMLRSGLAIVSAGGGVDFTSVLDFTGGAGSKTAGSDVVNTGYTPPSSASRTGKDSGGYYSIDGGPGNGSNPGEATGADSATGLGPGGAAAPTGAPNGPNANGDY